MGKFLNFFKNIGQGIKRGATKVVDWAKNKAAPAIGRVVRPIVDIGSKIGNVLSYLPGTAGLIGKGITMGGEAIKGLTNLLPNSNAKDKINDSINRIVDTGQNSVNRVSEGIQRFNNKVQPWINAGVNIGNRIGDMANKFAN